MTSRLPQDTASVLLDPTQAGPVFRAHILCGQWTANTTVSTLGMLFDRPAVIREVWVGCDAVPSDSDGTLKVTVKVRDVSEGAFDTLVNALDAETVILAANKAYQATLASETDENEQTVAAGDSLVIDLVNDSAAITTNAHVVVTVLYQLLTAVTA